MRPGAGAELGTGVRPAHADATQAKATALHKARMTWPKRSGRLQPIDRRQRLTPRKKKSCAGGRGITLTRLIHLPAA
ncbi:MAG: hypothetical protein AAF550_14205 [Myxococcota bacterium]